MKITKVSDLTGKIHTMDLPVTQQELDRYKEGIELIQIIFPNLTAEQREFLITGSTQKEWDEAFPPKEDLQYNYH